MKNSDESKNTVGRAMGRIPSGVFILCAREGRTSDAMMASWVQQVAFEPLAICVAIAKERPIRELISDSQRLALSVLGEQDSALMKRYARRLPVGADPFDGVDVLETPSGIPVLADGLAWLDCKLLQTVDFGADHDLFIAAVTDGAVLKEGQSFTHVRGNGFHY